MEDEALQAQPFRCGAHSATRWIAEIDVVGDPERLSSLDLTALTDQRR